MIGTIDSLNSTNTALDTLEVFTGTTVSCANYPTVIVACKTDQAGTLAVQFSTDKTNFDSTLTFNVAAGVNEVHRIVVTRPYYRIVFTNTSASNQTYLRLTTLLGDAGLLNSPLSGAVQQDADSIVVKSIGEEYLIAQGLFNGHSIVQKFGGNQDVDGEEDIWAGGGLYTGFPTGSAETVDVFSSSTADTSAGTGARTLKITGLDANYDYQEETITLNGTTAVTSANTYMRVNRAYVLTSGSGGENAGTLTCRHTTTTANVFFTLPAGYLQTQVAAYTIPAGYTGYIIQYSAQMNDSTSNSATISGVIREFGTATWRTLRPFSISTGNYFESKPYGGLQMPEKTDLVMRCLTVQNANAYITGVFDILLIKNT